jgi:hypothetical protein
MRFIRVVFVYVSYHNIMYSTDKPPQFYNGTRKVCIRTSHLSGQVSSLSKYCFRL